MNNGNFHTKGFAAALLAAVAGYSAITSAHSVSGSLGAAAGATDFYQVTCSDDGNGTPFYLVTSILATSSAATPHVSVQDRKDNVATNSTDPTNGDTSYSPEVHLNGDPGLYNVLIDKNGTGPQSYTLQFHCMTSGNVHTGTDIVTVQNQ